MFDTDRLTAFKRCTLSRRRASMPAPPFVCFLWPRLLMLVAAALLLAAAPLHTRTVRASRATPAARADDAGHSLIGAIPIGGVTIARSMSYSTGSDQTTLYLSLVQVPCPTAICGAVQIENGGVCCIGAPFGGTVIIPVRFDAVSVGSTITSMRTDGQYCKSSDSLDQAAWEPFEATRTYTESVAPGWSYFYVRVQYRDTGGNVSSVYCAQVTLEGYAALAPTP